MAEPTPLRRPTPDAPNAAERIMSLQKQLSAELEMLEQKTIDTLKATADGCWWAADEITKPGIKQELSRLAETITAAVQRIEAIRSR